MPYRNLPISGKHGNGPRLKPLNAVYTRGVPLRRQATPPPVRPTAWRQEPAAARQPRLYKWPVLTVFVAAVFAFAIFYGFNGKQNVAQAAFESVHTTAVVQKTALEDQRMETYKKSVTALIGAHPDANIAVSTIDVSNNRALTLGDQGTFTAASTAKLITALTLLHEAEAGRASLTQNIAGQKSGTLLRNMIVNSDNAAWDTLNNQYLSHETLKTYMASLGLTEYDPDVNTLLPADMARLMQKLYAGNLLNKTNTELLLSYMNQANKQEYIVSGVPSGYTVYHKAGWLDGLMHDVAIISYGKKTIVLAIYTYNATANGDSQANQELFRQITSEAVAAYFN